MAVSGQHHALAGLFPDDEQSAPMSGWDERIFMRGGEQKTPIAPTEI